MNSRFLIIPAALLFHVAGAQSVTASSSPTEATVIAPAATSTMASTPTTTSTSESTETGEVSYLDYKSVYDAETLEEEVKMATERFSLSKNQQDMWLTAAGDRRNSEKFAREKLSKTANYEKDGVYRGLRASQNTFHETITGYLTPVQKGAMERDRQILEEKRQRIAKLPPPPPPAPTVTVAPVDSSAIKETEKGKSATKKKKKKKAVAS